MRRENRPPTATIAFDVLDYDPAAWREVLSDIDRALTAEGLPLLSDDRWHEHEGFYELIGSLGEVSRIKSVLEAFTARVVVTTVP